MRNYFAKYIPCGTYALNAENALVNIGEGQLFLCSKDIMTGDIIHSNDGGPVIASERTIKFAKQYNEGECFSVLGKISPHAKWVKELDSFSEADIQPYNEPFDLIIDVKHLPDKDVSYIRIMCPYCKHFH